METQQNGISKKTVLGISIVGISVLILLLVVVGYLVFASRTQEDTTLDTVEEEPSPTPVPTPKPVVTPDASPVFENNIWEQSDPDAPILEMLYYDTHNTLINKQDGYSLALPAFTHVSLTPDCVILTYELSHEEDFHIKIVIARKDGDGPCAPTGVGIGSVNVTREITIDGKTYPAEGFRKSHKIVALTTADIIDSDKINELYEAEKRRFENDDLDEDEHVWEWLWFRVDEINIVYYISSDNYTYTLGILERILGSFRILKE